MKKKFNKRFLKRFLNVCVVLGLTLLLNGISFAAEKVYFYHTDATGTPLAMTDKDGNVVWEADYKPFGEEQEVTPYPENNKMFIGKEKDQETGLYYFGARYMDAGIGRFTTPDPVGISESDLMNPQRLNRYNYSLNNPYRYMDPDGNFAIRAIPQNFKDQKYSFRITFRSAPNGTVDRLVGFLSKYAEVAKTAGEKGIDYIGGESVTYDKKGIGIIQTLNEPITDAVFKGMLTQREKNKFSRELFTQGEIIDILERFSERDEYGEMNYPSPQSMIEKAKKNADESPFGKATRKHRIPY